MTIDEIAFDLEEFYRIQDDREQILRKRMDRREKDKLLDENSLRFKAIEDKYAFAFRDDIDHDNYEVSSLKDFLLFTVRVMGK